jgi:hypothetical protein
MARIDNGDTVTKVQLWMAKQQGYRHEEHPEQEGMVAGEIMNLKSCELNVEANEESLIFVMQSIFDSNKRGKVTEKDTCRADIK